MRSLYKKQRLFIVFALLFSFLLMSLIMMVATYNYFVEREQAKLTVTAESAANVAKAYSITGDPSGNWELRMSLSFSAQVSGTFLLVCDENGEVVLTSDQDPLSEYIGKKVPDIAAYSVRNLDGYTSFGTFGSLFSSYRYIHGSPICSDSGKLTGMVFASSSSEEVIKLFFKLIYIFLIISVITLITACVITSEITRRQVKPLNEMAQAARRFGMGDYSARVSVTGRKDEIGELTLAFNSMADSLEKAEKRRQEFIANISHELRTPMTTIGGFVDGLLDGTIPAEAQKEYLRTISEEVKRLSRLVSKMTELSRLQAKLAPSGEGLKREDFNISELLRVTILGMEQKINDKSLDVNADLGDEDIFVFAEKDSITQVVYNLLGNAVKFARENSTLGISIGRLQQKAVISFTNEGDTIPQKELEAIFERFHKTDASRSEDKDGLGLGLYIVKSIMNAHGEKVEVDSKNGLTSFTIYLPLSER
ncbi:MAG: HAMP domain-containing histidine kinase [Oscillospiraceae bacterium]|nr:HAMP domain-containing histidine kinase [Oscillospiraceae bacterium]